MAWFAPSFLEASFLLPVCLLLFLFYSSPPFLPEKSDPIAPMKPPADESVSPRPPPRSVDQEDDWGSPVEGLGTLPKSGRIDLSKSPVPGTPGTPK